MFTQGEYSSDNDALRLFNMRTKDSFAIRSAGHYAIEELQNAGAKRAVLHAFDGKSV
jgi:hypothetical protein